MSLSSERFPLTSGLRNKHTENDGFKVIFVCFVVFSLAITVALIVHIYYGEPEVVPHAAISTDHKTCSSLGAELMRRGGSAVDAAVAAALCMCVLHPHTSGLGGGGFLLVHDHAHNTSSALDFREVAPAATDPAGQVASSGARAVAVPGLLRGLQLAHRQHGRLPWAELVRPSALLARQGVTVTEQLAAALANHLSLAEAHASAGMSVFAAENRLLVAGDRLNLTDLANTLDLIEARGVDALYQGVLTARTLTELTLAGGILTSADMADYEPLQYEGLLRHYGDFSVLTTAAPSAGPALLVALAVMARANVSQADTEAVRYHRITEALRLSMGRFSQLGDPETSANVTNATEWLLSAATVAELADQIADDQLVMDSPLPTLRTPAATHISAVDDNELYVSVVSGLGSYFGAKFRTTTGILFNNAMAAFYEPSAQSAAGTANVPAPGRRPLSTASPAIVMAPKVCGQRVVVGGSDASILSQAVLRLVDPLALHNFISSLEAPRLHADQDSAQLGLEAGHVPQLSQLTVQSLKTMGHRTRDEKRPFPSCNGVTKRMDQLSSHSDSRGGGTASRF